MYSAPSISFHTLATDVDGIIPENFNVSDVQSRNITFSWDPPNTNQTTIIGYTVTCNDSLSIVSQNTSSTETIVTVHDLDPFTNYNCSVFARVEGNRGNSTRNITQQTAEEGTCILKVHAILKLHCPNSTLSSLYYMLTRLE